MEPNIEKPIRNTKDLKDKMKTNLSEIDIHEIDTVVNGGQHDDVFGGQKVAGFPKAGYDNWYPSEVEMLKFFEEHNPLTKQDYIFLAFLNDIDPFFKSKMTESQKLAHAMVQKELNNL